MDACSDIRQRRAGRVLAAGAAQPALPHGRGLVPGRQPDCRRHVAGASRRAAAVQGPPGWSAAALVAAGAGAVVWLYSPAWFSAHVDFWCVLLRSARRLMTAC